MCQVSVSSEEARDYPGRLHYRTGHHALSLAKRHRGACIREMAAGVGGFPARSSSQWQWLSKFLTILKRQKNYPCNAWTTKSYQNFVMWPREERCAICCAGQDI